MKTSRLTTERQSYWSRNDDDDERGRPYRIKTQTLDDDRYTQPQRPQPIQQPQSVESNEDRNAAVLLEALSKMTAPASEKIQVNLRLDGDVVEWIDSLGGARATRINQALRALMNLA